DGVPTWAMRGFVTDLGKNGEYREFTIGDASASLAARQNYTDQIGLITVALYLPYVPKPNDVANQDHPRGIGTITRKKRNDDFSTREFKVGDLFAVINIRYGDADPATVTARPSAPSSPSPASN